MQDVRRTRHKYRRRWERENKSQL